MRADLHRQGENYHFVMSWDEEMETLFPKRLSDLQRTCARTAHKVTGARLVENYRSLRITLPATNIALSQCRQLKRRVDANLQETFSASTTARRLKITTGELTKITQDGHIACVMKAANRQHRRYSFQAWRLEDILSYAKSDFRS